MVDSGLTVDEVLNKCGDLAHFELATGEVKLIDKKGMCLVLILQFTFMRLHCL